MKRMQFFVIGVLIAAAVAGCFLGAARLKERAAREKRMASEEALFKQAQALEAQGSLTKARELYQRLVHEYPQGKFALENQKLIWDLNVKMLFAPTVTPGTKIYEVQPQETLGKIAKKFQTTVELIMRANNLKTDMIRSGMRLKICAMKFTVLVDKSQNLLTLKADDEVFKVYNVSTGLDNCTPVGAFKVIVKIIDPTWYKAGAVVPPGSPKNILGTRWLGLSVQGYGIHGTTEPESIGKQATAGCVRMINKEVEELYTMVPIGTDVIVVD
ncbi:MAG: L,D-transpeptidase family protein [Candidatus Omnitrophota bacterium]